MNYIGIDIGTTSTKAVLFSNDGKVLRQHSIGYEMLHPEPDYSEQKPDEIYAAVKQCLDTVAANLTGEVVISFSSAMHSIMAVDKDGNPLSNLIIWADNRAKEIAEKLKKSDLGKEIYHRTGLPIHSFSFYPKLLWFKQNQPQIFAQAHKFIGIKEYVWFKFFGEYKIDYSLATGTGMFNIRNLTWDSVALQNAGIDKKKLPDIEPVTYKETVNTKQKIENWILGGGDGPLANLGTGAMQTGTMAFTMGTSGAVRLCSATPYTDLQMRTFSFVLSETENVIGGATNNGAVVVQWLKEQILKTDISTDNLLKSAEKIPAGADGLQFLPYLLGDRAPIWNADARGVFFGLGINHTQGHLVRAVMEAIVMNLYVVGRILMETQPVYQISASGGFAKSELWLQILADVFQKPVIVNDTVEGSAWGAVLIAKRAMGEVADENMDTSNAKIYQPNPQNKSVYEKKFEQLVRLYDKLKDEF
ncbi:MAG: gluconokinase [Spirosomataceae bacterium]